MTAHQHEPVFEIRLREEQRALADRILPRCGAAVKDPGEQRRAELRCADDDRLGGDVGAAERRFDEVEREAPLTRQVRKRRPCRRDKRERRRRLWLLSREPYRRTYQQQDCGSERASRR